MILFYICLIILCFLTAGAIWGSSKLRITEHQLFSNRIPIEFDGYRILLISDMHDRYIYKKLVKKVDRTHPDIILLGGDMHNRGSERKSFFKFAQYISKKYIVYGIRGNHDPFPGHREFDSYIKKNKDLGIKMISDTTQQICYNNACIYISGLDWDGNISNLSVDKNSYNILLTHDPKIFDNINNTFDLTLSGHVHGGFIELYGIGGVFAPGGGKKFPERLGPDMYFPRYYKGLYKKDNQLLFVSRGIGFSVLPFRFIPAEINVLVLRSQKK